MSSSHTCTRHAGQSSERSNRRQSHPKTTYVEKRAANFADLAKIAGYKAWGGLDCCWGGWILRYFVSFRSRASCKSAPLSASCRSNRRALYPTGPGATRSRGNDKTNGRLAV